ncbi:hypothetical protein HPB49_021151 [Dermacentor silvarum]|uniref:Uncharacterized protein n=1 Tax=Dermacentor silvarum TaxID=543639 RepID=A0ACB8DFT2_DERSI|nr:hypothetical protein HPB49_021151 [Dermacentor silvarum]
MPPKLSMTPDHKRKAMPLVPELSELPECLQNVVKGDVVITNAQQFLTWFSEVEEKMMEESDWEYTNYIDVVASYREKCCEVLCEIDASMAQLRLLQGEYEFVSNKTNALHEACEHLLDEQKMASPDISVLSESFIPMLTRLDECIGYLESNPQYKEAGTYLVKFKHMQWQALEMIRSYVTSTLEHTTHQVLSRKDPLCSTDNSFALLYGKFRTHAPRIHSLVGQIEERVERNAEYRELLDACHTCYFGQRETLLGPSVSTAMKELAAAHQRDHCSLVRSGCAFLVHLCEDEHQLYMQFFTKASSLLDDFLSHLCERLYDVFRPIIIHINHLETLAELCSILKVEMMEQHVAANPNELRAFCKIAQQMLEDVQERLVYRTLVYVRTDILGYNPAPEFQQRFLSSKDEKGNQQFSDHFSVMLEHCNYTVNLELVNLWCSPKLKGLQKEQPFLRFYWNLEKKKYGNIANNVLKLTSLLASAYFSEETFFLGNLNKSHLPPSVTRPILQDVLKTANSAMTLNRLPFRKQKSGTFPTKSIAESLAQNSLSRSSSRGSLVSIGSSASGSLPHLQSSIQSGERPNEVAVLQVSSAQHITETTGGSTTTHTTISAQNSDAVPSTRHKGYSPADLHGMWYPTVRRTLVCLSKLYRCVDKTIFQGLSQEVLAACIDSLSTAGKEISKNKATLDGELFQIKHLLILREQIAPFQIDFAIKETSLDFTRIRDAALSLYSKKSRLFSLGTNNALLQFVLEGSLSMKENLIDSKKAVDNQLKALCEEFIANSARMLVGPLQDFLDKANLILQVKEQEPTRTVSLRNQPFAAPDSVGTVASSAYRHLKSSLTALGRSMTLYLANKDTEQILFKPIKEMTAEVLAETVRDCSDDNESWEDDSARPMPSTKEVLDAIDLLRRELAG